MLSKSVHLLMWTEKSHSLFKSARFISPLLSKSHDEPGLQLRGREVKVRIIFKNVH